MILNIAFKCTSFEGFVADMLEFSDFWGFTGWATDYEGNRTYPKNGVTFTSKARLDWSWIPVLYDPPREVEFSGVNSTPTVVQSGTNLGPHMNLRLEGDLSDFMAAFNSHRGGLTKENLATKNGRAYQWSVMANGTRLLDIDVDGRGREFFPLTPKRIWYT